MKPEKPNTGQKETSDQYDEVQETNPEQKKQANTLDKEKADSVPTSGQNGDLNLIDLSRLRLPQDFIAGSGVKKLLTTVPVRRPDRQSWIRVNPDPTWQLETLVIEMKEEGETYLVERSLWFELSVETTKKVLFTAIDRQGNVFFWSIRLPGPDGRHDPWNASALIAAQEAMKRWVRVVSNTSLGAYDVFTADATLTDPIWPDIGFKGLLEIAFRDRFIRDLDHPVVRKLRGKL
jgi:hypothetical protein